MGLMRLESAILTPLLAPALASDVSTASVLKSATKPSSKRVHMSPDKTNKMRKQSNHTKPALSLYLVLCQARDPSLFYVVQQQLQVLMVASWPDAASLQLR